MPRLENSGCGGHDYVRKWEEEVSAVGCCAEVTLIDSEKKYLVQDWN